jgi:hypothetical protein
MFLTNLKSTGLTRTLACCLAASAFAAPVALGAPSQDLRSPDARDAGLAAQSRNYQDLRSPDARDAAGHYVSDVASENVAADTPGSGGFDWGTAGISVAALSGLLIISFAALSGTRHVKRRFARS